LLKLPAPHKRLRKLALNICMEVGNTKQYLGKVCHIEFEKNL